MNGKRIAITALGLVLIAPLGGCNKTAPAPVCTDNAFTLTIAGKPKPPAPKAPAQKAPKVTVKEPKRNGNGNVVVDQPKAGVTKVKVHDDDCDEDDD
jgi:hypothetical protein